jgi:hypothetical protein
MNTKALVREITKWVSTYTTVTKLNVVENDDTYSIEFLTNTTKTRASFMVTRISLIVKEILADAEFYVGKELLGPKPETRSSLALWKIYVHVQKRKRKTA